MTARESNVFDTGIPRSWSEGWLISYMNSERIGDYLNLGAGIDFSTLAFFSTDTLNYV